jgi:predicted alpha/beta-hydrolase family hydrolase
MTTELSVPLEAGGATSALLYDSGQGGPALVLAHGAGAGQRSPFMVGFARALAALGVDVVTFNFPYIEHRRRIPDRTPILEDCYRAVIDEARQRIGERRPLFIGGKSMGGRIATQVAAADPDLPIDGIALLGYPLHPPGRPQQRRDKHLPAIRVPILIAQGSRDTFGTPPEFEPILRAAPTATLYVVVGGDHSFKLARKDAAAQAAIYDDLERTIVEWIEGVSRPADVRRI